jgi:1,2-phenylacetyl-CoA epoxidase catalytic subunit
MYTDEKVFWFMMGAASSTLVSLLIGVIMDYFNPKMEKEKIQDGFIKDLQDKIYHVECKVNDLKVTERTLRGAYTDISGQVYELKALVNKPKKKKA